MSYTNTYSTEKICNVSRQMRNWLFVVGLNQNRRNKTGNYSILNLNILTAHIYFEGHLQSRYVPIIDLIYQSCPVRARILFLSIPHLFTFRYWQHKIINGTAQICCALTFPKNRSCQMGWYFHWYHRKWQDIMLISYFVRALFILLSYPFCKQGGDYKW